MTSSIALTLAPGTTTSVGTLTAGATTLNSASALDFTLNSNTQTASNLTVNGLLTLGSSALNVTDLGSTVLAMGTTFDLANYTSLSGTFAGYANDSDLTIGVNTFEIQYGANEISLMAVPEPATWAMLIGGLGALVFVVRRPSRKLV